MNKNFNQKNILLIDDDENQHFLVKGNLKKSNANLLSAKNGQEGLNMYKENKVDLVLLDINMPGMDGYETLIKLKEINYDVDVIMCTANDDSHQKAYDVGAIAYLKKPLDFDKLLHMIDVLLKLPKVN
jgi:DNA-binding response OmpR family regulator